MYLGYGNFLLHIQANYSYLWPSPWPRPLFDFCGRKRKKTNGKLGKLSFQFRLWDKLLVVSHAAHKLNAQLHHFWLSHLGGFQTNQQKALNRDVRRWGAGGQVLGYQLTPFGPRGADYARHITTCPPPHLLGWCGVSAKGQFFKRTFWKNWGYQKVLLKLTKL